MEENIFKRLMWFIGLVLLQALVLNNVHVFGYATPFLYIYFIIKLSPSTSRNGLMMWAFFLGLSVDIFSDTPGMNAAASVLLAFVCPFYLRLFAPRDVQDIIVPSARTMGNGAFFKYVLASVLTHHIALFCLIFFSFTDVFTLIIKIVTSTILTIACILAIEGIRR